MQDQQAQSIPGAFAVSLFLRYGSNTSRISLLQCPHGAAASCTLSHDLQHCPVSEPLGMSEGALVQVNGPCLCLCPVLWWLGHLLPLSRAVCVLQAPDSEWPFCLTSSSGWMCSRLPFCCL